MTTYNMRTRRRLLSDDAKTSPADHEKVRQAARNMCRMSSLVNERDALRLAEAGYGWKFVMGTTLSPRVSESLARQLVLGVP